MPQPRQYAEHQVTLLMGVRNGAAHLPAQLHSIAAQHHKSWHLTCSDDLSADASLEILAQFAQDHPGRVDLVKGPQQGFAANYLQLIRNLPPDMGFVGFADQDDIWTPDKISRGLVALRHQGMTPTLYCSRRWDWFPQRQTKVATKAPEHPCGFRNALIENVAFGNTILLNPAAAGLARTAAQRTRTVYAHDWWLYLLITGAGGKVVFDPGPPSLLYRQHRQNAIGSGRGFSARIRRKRAVLQGAFAEHINDNLHALAQVRDLLTPTNRKTLDHFSIAREQSLLPRLAGLRRVAPYRQSRMGSLGFWGAASLGRI